MVHPHHQHQESTYTVDPRLTVTGIFIALDAIDMWHLHYQEVYCLFVIFGTNNGLENDMCIKDFEAVPSTRNETNGNGDEIEELVPTNWTQQIDKQNTTEQELITAAAFYGDVAEINVVVGFNETDGICTVCLEAGHVLALINVSIKAAYYALFRKKRFALNLIA